MKIINKATDCWRCGQTFGEPVEIGYIGNHLFTGKIVTAYHEDDILCMDCMDAEQLAEGLVP